MTTATDEVTETKKAAAGAKISLPLVQLQKALATVAPAVQRKTTIPVLSSVRIEQTETALDFAATDLDLAIRVRIAKPDAKAQPVFLLPALKLDSYSKLLAGEEVSITCADTRATLRCGRSNTKLPLMSAASFPVIKFADEGTGMQISQEVADRILRFTTFAISEEESRYTLNGALLEVGDGKLQLIATDGHRLVRYTVASDIAAASMLIPSGMLRAIGKTLDGDAKAMLLIETSEDSIFANIEDRTGGIALTHRRMTGTFPNYKAIMPTEQAACLIVSAAETAAALKRCMAFADERSGAVKLTFTGDGEIKLRAANTETGETDEAIDARTSAPFHEFAVGFNGKYLLDAFSRLDGEVQIRFSKLDGQTSILIYAEPAAGETFEYVVMPMRV